MIHEYDDDEVVSVEDVVKHEPHCKYPGMYGEKLIDYICTCTPIQGQRIVIEKWDDYVVKVKEKANG